jgi:hypothetical protein
MQKDELIIQLRKIGLGFVFAAYFVWWSLAVLSRLIKNAARICRGLAFIADSATRALQFLILSSEIRHRSSGRSVVKQFSVLGIIVGAALLTVTPLSLHYTPKKAGLYVDTADARVVHRRRPYYGYYGVGTPYRLSAPTPYYGIAPYGGITPYGVAPYPYSLGPPTGGFFLGSK